MVSAPRRHLAPTASIITGTSSTAQASPTLFLRSGKGCRHGALAFIAGVIPRAVTRLARGIVIAPRRCRISVERPTVVRFSPGLRSVYTLPRSTVHRIASPGCAKNLPAQSGLALIGRRGRELIDQSGRGGRKRARPRATFGHGAAGSRAPKTAARATSKEAGEGANRGPGGTAFAGQGRGAAAAGAGAVGRPSRFSATSALTRSVRGPLGGKRLRKAAAR